MNSAPATVMHIDLNSCFATIEQQANPFLRGKPIAVGAYATPNGCVLAASVEAKRYGIKTGMRVRDGKMLYPNLIVLEPDAEKYREVHRKLRILMSDYTDLFFPKSIDEFVLHFDKSIIGYKDMKTIGLDIKTRIKEEIGDWLTVSVGIGTNRFFAKTAAGLHKPDGLDEMDSKTASAIYQKLTLVDLHGINVRNKIRLQSVGIYTPLQFSEAPLLKIKAAFQSINALYWYTRLRGWEIDSVEFERKSFGNQYALGKPLTTVEEISPILAKLVTKTSARLRRAKCKAKGVHIALRYKDGSFWHKGQTIQKALYDTRDIFCEMKRVLILSPRKPISLISETCFNLLPDTETQTEIFEDVIKREKTARAMDFVNDRWGAFVITPARMIGTQKHIPDRIAFGGGMKELESIIAQTEILQ